MTSILILAALGGAIALLAGNASARRRWLIAPLLARFRQGLPRLSDTERQALEAGTVGWEAELFAGRPDWRRFLDQPAARLSAGEQAFLDGPADGLCAMIDDWRVTHHDYDLSPEAWAYIKTQRFFGMIIPPEWGGLGFSSAAHSAVVMKLATRSVTAAVTVMVPNSLGPAKLLLHYGTEEQRRRYLPRLARGEEIPCFALTGPQAGSDAAAIPDTGVVCRGAWRGETVLGVRLDFDKRYITLAPVATLIGLAFRCLDPDRLLGREEDLGISIALLPRDTPGVAIGRRHLPLNIPFMNGPIRGRGVFVPLEQIVGGVAGIGQGWRMLMESLSEGRGISLPALATGAAKLAARHTGAYARLRRQFNEPVGRFEGVEEALARIAGLTYQMDAARGLTLAALDRGDKPAVLSAIVKYHLTEGYRRVIADAMDIQGGSGICLGPGNLLGRAWQAVPVAITVEGANILTRSLIIFGQGAIRCHPWLLRELEAAHHPDPDTATRLFDRAVLGHARHLLGNLARAFALGLSRGRLAAVPVGRLAADYRRLAWSSAALAVLADAALMTLGGTLKRRERLSARLGDILSGLVLASAVLKRYRDDGEPAEDLPLARRALAESGRLVREGFSGVLHNLPGRPLARLLRGLLFPFGLPAAPLTNRDDHAAATLLLAPSAARDRLTAGVYLPADPGERGRQLDDSLAAAQALEPLEARLRALRRTGGIEARDLAGMAAEARARGHIGAAEAATVRDFLARTEEVVRVDDFADFTAGAPLEPDRHGRPTPLATAIEEALP
jgi:acyl-CoA dehydrogenase